MFLLSMLDASRQKAHTSELCREEGVEDEHHRLWARVEVEHLQDEGRMTLDKHRKDKKRWNKKKTTLNFNNLFLTILSGLLSN